SETRAPKSANCGFSGHFLDTARPSHTDCRTRRSSGSDESFISCRAGGEGHDRRLGAAKKRGAGSTQRVFQEPREPAGRRPTGCYMDRNGASLTPPIKLQHQRRTNPTTMKM